MTARDEQGQGTEAVHAEASPEEAKALVERITVLRQELRWREALARCDELIQRFQGSGNPAVDVQVARAFLNKSASLIPLQRYDEALPLIEDVLRRYDGAAGPEASLLAAKALGQKGYLLELLGRSDEARRVHEEVLRRHGDAEEGELITIVASTRLSLAGLQERGEPMLSALEDVMGRYSASPDEGARVFALLAAVQKLAILRRAGRREEEALALCEQTLQRYKGERDQQMLGSLALVLSMKSSLLNDLNRLGDALATYDEAIHLLERATVPHVVDQWALAVFNKAFELEQRQRLAEALPCYDLVVERLAASPEEELRVRAVGALVDKAAALERLQRPAEAVAALDAVTQRWGQDPSAEVLGLVAETLLDKGLLLVRQGQVGEAMTAFSTVFRRFEGSGEEALRERAAKAIFCSALLLFALNQTDDALALVGKARRKLGGETGATLLHAVHALADKGQLFESMGLVRPYLSLFDAVMEALPESGETLHRDRMLALRRVSLVLLGEARRLVKDKREQAMKLLEKAWEKALVLVKLEPGVALHLGHAGHLAFLTGRREEAGEFVREALHKGGGESPHWVPGAGPHDFPEDVEFLALVRSSGGAHGTRG